MFDRLQKLREERANSDKGFTLIELLVVVVILGILIAIAIPLYLNYTKGSSDKTADSDVRNAIAVLETCNSDNGAYPAKTAFAVNTNNGVCGAQRVNTSANTTLVYLPATGLGTYEIYGYNTKGSGSTQATSKNFCYFSGDGGAVKTELIGWPAPRTAGSC